MSPFLEFYLVKAVTALVLPPGGNLLLALAGLLSLFRHRALGVSLLLVSVVSLYGLSTPMAADALSERLETDSPYPLKAPRAARAGAIVVLGGGRNEFAPEYGGQTVSPESLERARYAARLQRKTGLPILVTGGALSDRAGDEATLMKTVLADDFRAMVKWTEPRARTTEENARYSAEVLSEEGIGTVLLVSHAAHLGRAGEAFERYGIDAVPAPTGFRKRSSPDSFLRYLPSARALADSARMLHEALGGMWYGWRYG